MKRLLPLLTAFSLLLATPLAAATLAGKVAFASKRGQNPTVNETVVWLEPQSAARAAKLTPQTVKMTTRGKALLPHVLAIPVGSTVEFPNDDPIAHNLFSLSSANTFDLGLYRKGAGKSHKFDAPGIVNVYCNVHPNMSAVVHVMATPYYAFADAKGNYSLAEVPAGKYRLLAWNEQGGVAESPVEVASNGAVAGNLSLSIDSRNFRLTQHLNKTGKPYTPPSSSDY
jgi:plastocyanin